MKVLSATYLGDIKITRQQTPVNVRPVSDVRVVVLSGRCLQYFLHKPLGVVRLLQEQLDDCRQYL